MSWFVLWAFTSVASGAARDDWQDPTSMLGVGAAPWGPRAFGHALLGSQFSAEVGLALRDFEPSAPVFDWALYWRPSFACFGCGHRALVTAGIGVGGPITPSFDGGPWALGLGPDLTVSGVAWVSRSVGAQVTGRVGFGPTVTTDAFTLDVVEPWFTISGGLAF